MTAHVATYVRTGQPTKRGARDLEGRCARLSETVARWPGYMLVASYVDVTCTQSLARPALAALLADAAVRRFDVVVVENLDQLVCDLAAQRALLCHLAAVGAWACPLADGQRARAAGWAAVALLELLGK